LRAAHKIAEHSVKKQDTKKVDPFLVIAAVCTAINCALRLNMSVVSLSQTSRPPISPPSKAKR
jgi:hypothetical protein